MHQAILVYTQVHKGTKLRHVAHRAFEHHAFFEVGHVFDAFVEAGHGKVGARVTAGFFKLTQNVFDGDDAKTLIGKQLGAQGFEHVSAAHEFGHRLAD